MERILSCTILPEWEGLTVDAVLRRRFRLSSRQIGTAKFRENGIMIDGVRSRTSRIVRAGETLRIAIPGDEEKHTLLPLEGTPDIRFECEDFVVVNKPGGMATHPSHGHYADTLANLLTGYYAGKGEAFVFRPVGRLDLETSGLLCIAKNAAAAEWFARDRERKVLKRQYLALCHGHFEEKRGIIDQPIRNVPGTLMVREVHGEGLPARTEFEVLAEYRFRRDGQPKAEKSVSLVQLTLDTGRTHQIRVHMAWLGHTLLGDRIYGSQDLPDFGMKRAALHAWRLSGIKPFTTEEFEIRCELPEDMRGICGGRALPPFQEPGSVQ